MKAFLRRYLIKRYGVRGGIRPFNPRWKWRCVNALYSWCGIPELWAAWINTQL